MLLWASPPREREKTRFAIGPGFSSQSDRRIAVAIIKSKNEARAGVTGHRVRYVLVFGLSGVIIAFLLLAYYFGLV
jgi:hypothetical protein